MIALKRMRHMALALVTVAACSFSPAVLAQEIRIGMGADITSVDPHFVNLFPNNNIAWHVLDRKSTRLNSGHG